MAKKKGGGESKAAAKAAKKDKAAKKTAKKELKTAKKGKGKDEQEDEDLETILERFQQEWVAQHQVTSEVSSGPPSRRANASLVACPSGNYLWCIGGEYFDGDKAYFYNDVYRYEPAKDEWKKYTSPNCPGPRSAHACCASPIAGGKLFIFGGEFASPKQTTFHHFRDFWEFDVTTQSWERIETKIKPSPRSGHRMVVWKHLIILFGGFYDLGVRTNYLDDLWIFDTTEYKWKQVDFTAIERRMERRPTARSGFSLLSCAEGVVLHGGYCKVYEKGKRTKGVALDDTWLLKIDPENPMKAKWEKRRKVGYAPTTRSGCSMTLWHSKNMGVLFGGVFDDDRDEETLESVFYNDLYGYNLAGTGRWISLNLKKPKKKGPRRVKAKPVVPVQKSEDSDEDDLNDENDNAASDDELLKQVEEVVLEEEDPDDPQRTVPLARYNTMIAVLKNTLYVYGGIYENQNREFTLDDFYTLQLDKMEKFVCLRESGIDQWNESDEEEDGSDSEDEEGSEGRPEEEEEEDEEQQQIVLDVDSDPEPETQYQSVMSPEEKAALRAQAAAFVTASKEVDRSLEDMLSTPLPGENLRQFYERSREYWAQRSHSSGNDNRGKALRRDGFQLAEDRYETYKPILQEIEKIQREAGLEEEDLKNKTGGGGGANGESRNRR